MNDLTTNSSFRVYLGILRRRWLLMIVVVGLCVLVGMVQLSRQTPQYRAVSEILLDQMIIPSNGGVGIYLAERQLENDLAFANSPLVGEKMADQLGYLPVVSAGAVNADVVSFTSVSTSPTDAATEANLFAETFIVARRERLLNTFTSAIAERDAAIADLQQERAALDPADPASLARIGRLDAQIAGLTLQRDDLRLSSRIQSAGGATIISPAGPPGSPFAPDRSRSLALALLLGLLSAAAAAWVREHFDDTIRTREDLDRVAGPLPYLGALPRDRGRARENPALVAEHGPLDEAFRSLRTSVQFVGLRQPLRSMQITSANAAEGKTTTAAYLAAAMAQAGERVVLMDGDLRNPNLHHRFGLTKEPGLSDLLVGAPGAVHGYNLVPSSSEFWVIPSGTAPGNAANFLWASSAPTNGPVLVPYIKSLTDRGYFVVVDSPPTLPVADALTLSHMVDGTLFVVAAGKTRGRDIARAMERLAQADARVIGIVLNGLADSRSGYGYRYGYGTATRWSLFGRRKTVAPRPSTGIAPSPALTHTAPDSPSPPAVNGWDPPTNLSNVHPSATSPHNGGLYHHPTPTARNRASAGAVVDLRLPPIAPGPEATLVEELRALVGSVAEPRAPQRDPQSGNGTVPSKD